MTNQTNWKEVTGVEPYVMWTYPECVEGGLVYYHNGEACYCVLENKMQVIEIMNNNDSVQRKKNTDEMIILTPQAKPFDLCTFFGV
jgi:hypothetical protein